MFTGIIEEIGSVHAIKSNKNLSTISIRAKKILPGLKKGQSIAVNGVCLSVISKAGSIVTFDLMKETLDATTLGTVKKGTKVNLERALKANGRVDGHFVSGHVECVGIIKEKKVLKNYLKLVISIDKSLRKFVVNKGSICLDGISLTVGEVKNNMFSVYLIPLTLEETTIGSKNKGDRLNIETDILAKYVLNHGR